MRPRTRPMPMAVMALAAIATPAFAEDGEPEKRRTRIGLGAQLVPSYPGADTFSVRPLVDIARARGDRPFEFEAPDESFGFPVLREGGFAFGPALGFEGSRKAREVGTALPRVGFTFEAGAFVQYALSESLRLRAEVRKGLGGHKGLIANISADLVRRKGDDWLFSIGPRITIADKAHHRAYFSVAPANAAPSGLPAYSARAGVQAVGLTAGHIAQLTRRWGLYSYAKYDRLVGDAARSPIVRRHGARDQWSGGLALTYSFGGR
ncbi:MipA/OmpV family protein [Sphingomonas colocasiae]|uniref:MipA/OmpV family protein n=1 Tax=Sphingomonas colocasiae TaxID=1848973 RepID=A0ABS7PPP5_9SPHN|nr:MipA/OmpV family protein [Sphingomonas colocasiae]MBY8823302.1 MipA/OmpV family protein [Sphingomonas colocasiae]MBY8826437.1 MipA/OmpV family protein [Sphingomonas colocasiae]